MRRSRARTVVNWKASSVPVVAWTWSSTYAIIVRYMYLSATQQLTAPQAAGQQVHRATCGCGRKAGQFCNFVSGSGSQPHDMEAGLGWAGLQRQSIRCQMLDARWQMADGGWQRARGQIGCSTSQAHTHLQPLPRPAGTLVVTSCWPEPRKVVAFRHGL